MKRRKKAGGKRTGGATSTSQALTVQVPLIEKPQPSPPQRLTVSLSIVAILISIISAITSILQTMQTRKTIHAHVRPDVQCVVRHSSLPQYKDKPSMPELVVWNNGPIKAVSMYASYRAFVFNPDTLEVVASMGISEDLLDYSIVQPQLEVGQRIGKTILGIDTLAVYVVSVDFYRENDMEKFSREDFFLYDSGTFHGYADFKARKDFERIMKNLQIKMRAERLKPATANRQMPPALPGAAVVNFNVGNLNEDGSWTNRVGTNPITFVPLQKAPTNN